MIRRMVVLMSVITAAATLTTLTFAHPGGLDAYGGHNDRKHGGYHFHRGSHAGQAFASKAQAIAAVGPGSSAQSATIPSSSTNPTHERSTEERVEALARLLIRKGIVTQAEIDAELTRLR